MFLKVIFQIFQHETFFQKRGYLEAEVTEKLAIQ